MSKYINCKRQMSMSISRNKSVLTGDLLDHHSNSEHPVQQSACYTDCFRLIRFRLYHIKSPIALIWLLYCDCVWLIKRPDIHKWTILMIIYIIWWLLLLCITLSNAFLMRDVLADNVGRTVCTSCFFFIIL